MTAKVLRYDQGGICTLTLSRPDKLNALNTETFVELDGHLAELERATDTIGCVVLRGAGSKAFCAGADLKQMGAKPVPPAFKPGVIERLGTLPQPVVAAVHGVCYTGGLELALACDFIIADATVRFADTHGKWGLVSQWGMTQRLPRRIGVSAAKRLMMTGREVKADESLSLGLIDLLAEAGGLDRLIAEFTGRIVANSWHTNFAVKRLMRETEHLSLAAGLAYEHVHHPGFAPDHGTRIAAFKG